MALSLVLQREQYGTVRKSKASKHLYIIRVLKRSSMPSEDLISIYIALVRSVFRKIKSENNNKLTSLVPSTRHEEYGLNLRDFDKLSTLKCNTDRFMKSFFPCMTQMLNNVDD